MRAFVFTVLLAAGLLAAGLYGFGYLPLGVATNPLSPEDGGEPPAVANTGGQVQAGEPAPQISAAPGNPRKSGGIPPIVIPDARVAIMTKQEVPSLRDGQILVIGTELPRDQIPPDRLVEVKVGNETRTFRKLKVGDEVKKDQLLALLDPRLALDDLAIKEFKVLASEADQKASLKTRDEAEQRYRTLITLRQRAQNAVSEEELRGAKLTWDRYFFEEISKRQAIEYARREQSQAETVLKMYDVRSENVGQVKMIYKNQGEAVKALEPVMLIQNQDRLRLEGLVEIQYLPYLEDAKQVVIEPTIRERPSRVLTGHLADVTGVAVTGDPKSPAIVSGSEDGSVRLWDPATGRETRILRFPAAVRAVACTPPDKSGGSNCSLCVIGLGSGSAWLWDLKADEVKELDGLSSSRRAINSVAFSQDGSLCAAGFEDGSIVAWDTTAERTGERFLYRFPAGHRAGVTSLQFLPDNQLVSAGRDNALLLWKVDQKSAVLQPTKFDRRSGHVTMLGASPDGKSVLFDQGRELRILSLPDGYTEGVLENSSSANNFTTMALFSPDGKLVLTAGQASGGLQLWHTPDEKSRGYEMRQFVSNGSVPTCGAFSPDGSFVVTGSKDRLVYIWPVPAKAEIDQQLTGDIVLLEKSLSGSRRVRIWAEANNQSGRLIPDDTVTLVVYPKK